LFIRALECFYNKNDDNHEAIVYGHNRNSSQKSPQEDRTADLSDDLDACHQEYPKEDGDFDGRVMMMKMMHRVVVPGMGMMSIN